MQATSTVVKMNRKAPIMSQVKMDWKEKQDRNRKSSKVNRRKMRDVKRNWNTEDQG
ncbi:hypothetical protein NVP1187O_240 [Vibrio phage 1.187.O._10N.286.49.F1]|nr:hypothetical protein NVP1187O_240 [Vibrio phage 1.187.O._10N.286.49.F1]